MTQIQARVTYRLSEKGRRDSLRQGGDGKERQMAIGSVAPGDLDAFVVDDKGEVSLDATEAPEKYSTDKCHWRLIALRPRGSRIDILWDVVPTWDDLLSFARWANQERERQDNEIAAELLADREAEAETAKEFLANPDARADRIEEDWVTIGGHDFWSSHPVAVEAKRRFALDHEERRKANRETLRIWITDHGSENQRQRLVTGLLPWQEAYESLERHLFAPLEKFEPYTRFNVENICVCEHAGETPCGLKFQSVDATDLTADQWDTYSAIRSVVPDAQFQLREHRAKCRSRSETEMKRGVIVKRTVGSLTFKREYALGGSHDVAGV